jgi:hypothetical protein
MSFPLTVEYSPSGIATAKESWYVEEKMQPELETLEHARRLSQLTRRAAAVREMASQLQELVEAHRQDKERADESERRFRQLAEQWIIETGLLSDPIQKFLHPAHLKIIGMGERVLPFILKEVEKMSGHWFVALDAVSPVNPVQPEDQTNLKRMAEAWIQWGKIEGLI